VFAPSKRRRVSYYLSLPVVIAVVFLLVAKLVAIERAEIIERMEQTFEKLHGLTESSITPDELAKAEQLVAEKFGTDDWLQRVP